MKSRRRISAGQRYRDTRRTAFGFPSRTIWKVERTWRAIDGLTYAELVHEGDPLHRKTLSTAVFDDRSQFAAIAAESVGSKVPTGGEIGLQPLSATG